MTVSYAHLLVVSPDEQLREAVCIPLRERQWYALSVAADLPETLAVLERETVDVLLVDVDLATAGESRFLRAVRAVDEAHRLIILLVAPAGSEKQVREGLQAGASDWLVFPTDPLLLKSRCDLAVQQVSLQQQLRSSAESFQEMMRLAKDLSEKILPLGVALAGETDYERLLARILREAKAFCQTDAGALFLVTADNTLRLALAQYDSLQFDWQSIHQSGYPFARLPLAGAEEEEPDAQDVLARVALTGQTVSIADINQEDRFNFSALEAFDAASGYRTISLLAVPLRNERVQGVLLLINAQEAETGRIIPFSRYHLLVTESLAAQAGVVMHNHALREHAARLRVLQEELRIGRQIQAGFFPAAIPQPAGWEIAAHLRPAREVGGDFYDVFALPGGRLGFVVADVCGKGVGAALFMALIRTLIRAFIERDVQDAARETPAGQVLTSTVAYTNQYIMAHHADDYIFSTLFIGLLQPDSGVLHYVNAGHVPPLWVDSRQGKAHQLGRSGPAVGLVKEAIYRQEQMSMAAGDWLLIYTDGVTEARNAAGKPFGRRRLEKVVVRPTIPAEQLLGKIDEQVTRFTGRTEPQDDVTMLALHCLPA